MGNISLWVMSMFATGNGASVLGQGSSFMDIFFGFLSLIWDTIGDTIMSVVYFVVRFMLNIVDFLQFFVGKLVGINVWMDGSDVTSMELQDLDIIFRFLYSSEVQRVFKALIIIGAVLLIIFTIIAVVQSEYKTATGDEKAFKNGKMFVLKRALTAVTLMIFVPIMTIVGILASNAILASLTKTLNANTTLTFGGQIFVASSYDASRYRYYAMTGDRIPVSYPKALEVINPSDVTSTRGYYLVNEHDQLIYDTIPLDNLNSDHAYLDCAHNTWEYNKKYKDYKTDWDDSYKLFDVSWTSGSGEKYSAFIVDNAVDTNYKNEYDFVYKSKEGDYLNSDSSNIYLKAYSTGHTGYATYAPMPVEYMVVADFIDYAIEYSKKVHIVNVTNPDIDWSNVPQRYYKLIDNDGKREAVEIAVDYKMGLYNQKVSGRVIYRGNNDANSETQGAQYIYATEENGKFVPILANQKNEGIAFTSSYLADGYEGVIIARGVFDNDGNPTEIYQASTDGMEFTDTKYVLANAYQSSTVDSYVSRVDFNHKSSLFDEDVYYLGISVTYKTDGDLTDTVWYGFNNSVPITSESSLNPADPALAKMILDRNSDLSYSTYYEGDILKVKVYDKSRNITFVLPSNYFEAKAGEGKTLESLSFKNISMNSSVSIGEYTAQAEHLVTKNYAIDLQQFNINGTPLKDKTVTLSYHFDNQLNSMDFSRVENVTIGGNQLIRLTLNDDYSLILRSTALPILIAGQIADVEKTIDYMNTLFNPEYLYQFNFIGKTYNVLPLKEVQENGVFTYNRYQFLNPGHFNTVSYNIDYDKIPNVDYVISFKRNDIKWGIGADININFSKLSTFRFHIGLTYAMQETRVAKLPVDSGMVLNYNFSSSNGISMQNLFKPSRINPIVLIFASVLIFKILGDAVWGMVKRIFDIVIHFIVLPGFVSTIALDDGARFGKWKEGVIKAIFGAYGVILGLNFFFILVPILKDATEIFTASDLPSSLEGTFVGNSIFANADVLNNIVYILFLMVAFTLIKSMPTMIATWFGAEEYASKGADIRADVKKNNKAVADFVSGRAAKGAIKDAVNTFNSFIPGSVQDKDGNYENIFTRAVSGIRNRVAGAMSSAAESVLGRSADGSLRSPFRRRSLEERISERESRMESRTDRIDFLRSKDFSTLTKAEQKELIQLQKEQAKDLKAVEKYNEQMRIREEKQARKESDKAKKDAAVLAAEADFNNLTKDLQTSYAQAMASNNTEAMRNIEANLKAMFKDYAKKSPEIKKDKDAFETMLNRMRAQGFHAEYEELLRDGKSEDAEKKYQEFLATNTFGKKFNRQLRDDVNAKRLAIAKEKFDSASKAYYEKPNAKTTSELQAARDALTQATYMSQHKLSDTTLARIKEGKAPRKLRKMQAEARKAMFGEAYATMIDQVASGDSALSGDDLLRSLNVAAISKKDKKKLKGSAKRAAKANKAQEKMNDAQIRSSKATANLEISRQQRAVQRAAQATIQSYVSEYGTSYTARLSEQGITQEMFEEFIGRGSYLNANFMKRLVMKAGSILSEKVSGASGSKQERVAKRNRKYGKAEIRASQRNRDYAQATQDASRIGRETDAITAQRNAELAQVRAKKQELDKAKKEYEQIAQTKPKAGKELKQLADFNKYVDELKKLKAGDPRIETLTQKISKIAEAKGLGKVKELTPDVLNQIAKKLGTKAAKEAANAKVKALEQQLKQSASTLKKTNEQLQRMKKEMKATQEKIKENQRASDKAKYSAVAKKADAKDTASTESSAGSGKKGNAAKRRDTGGAGNAGMKD